LGWGWVDVDLASPLAAIVSMYIQILIKWGSLWLPFGILAHFGASWLSLPP